MLWALLLLAIAVIAGLAVMLYTAYPYRGRPVPQRSQVKTAVRREFAVSRPRMPLVRAHARR